MKRWVWAVLIAVLIGSFAIGGFVSQDQAVSPEARSAALADQIRCPTCAGLSVADSGTPLAASSREEIERRVAEGQSDEEVRRYFVSRYGTQALLSPPREGFAGLVWTLPVGVAVLAAVGLALGLRKWRRQPDNGEQKVADQPAKIEPSETIETVSSADAVKTTARMGTTTALAVVAFVALTAGLLYGAVGDRLTGETSTGDIAADSNTLLRQAREQTANRRADQAVRTYDQVLAIDPDNAEALAYRGWLLRLGGFPEEGFRSIDQAVAADPAYPDARFFKGFILLSDLQRPAEAVTEFEAFLANDPPPALVPLVEQSLADARAQAAQSPRSSQS